MEIDESTWPEKPYRWIVNDLRIGIDAKANYLVALGLFCYTEFMGREVLRFSQPNNKKINSNKYNKISFNLFLSDYMGYKSLVKTYGNKLYDWFRNGVSHEYHIKASHSGVFKSFKTGSEQDFKKLGIDISQGLIVKQKDKLPKNNLEIGFLIMEPYLKDFTKGIQKFLEENKII
ncbi:MAG: hypothetical protein ACOZAJ_03615 [Patescibacteria group bacterium]